MYCYSSAHLAQAYGKEKGRGYFPLAVTYCDPICNAEIFAAAWRLKTCDFYLGSMEANTDEVLVVCKIVEIKKEKNKRSSA